jgi:Rad3-related DNA helicase
MSEGLNFTNNLARACFIVGVPYRNMSDSSVILKMEQLDRCERNYNKKNNMLSGKEWYK